MQGPGSRAARGQAPEDGGPGSKRAAQIHLETLAASNHEAVVQALALMHRVGMPAADDVLLPEKFTYGGLTELAKSAPGAKKLAFFAKFPPRDGCDAVDGKCTPKKTPEACTCKAVPQPVTRRSPGWHQQGLNQQKWHGTCCVVKQTLRWVVPEEDGEGGMVKQAGKGLVHAFHVKGPCPVDGNRRLFESWLHEAQEAGLVLCIADVTTPPRKTPKGRLPGRRGGEERENRQPRGDEPRGAELLVGTDFEEKGLGEPAGGQSAEAAAAAIPEGVALDAPSALPHPEDDLYWEDVSSALKLLGGGGAEHSAEEVVASSAPAGSGGVTPESRENAHRTLERALHSLEQDIFQQAGGSAARYEALLAGVCLKLLGRTGTDLADLTDVTGSRKRRTLDRGH